jgi:hypothetical protein
MAASSATDVIVSAESNPAANPASYVELYPIFRQQNPTSNLLTRIIQAASLFSLKSSVLREYTKYQLT